MENRETTSEAAIRETLEEANATVKAVGLYALFNIPHISQVYIMFRAQMLDTHFGPGPESLDVKLFDEREIPWDSLAFPVIRETLIRYYKDKQKGKFTLHVDDIFPDPPA